jgi:1-deoxy-D-xylulose-5-phosphate reductoisomerase
MAGIRAEEAVKHPTWNMGAKISVDSATLMNKGLEIIEAMWLFGLPLNQIEPVIHPQSIVHALVEFTDGSMLAHLGVTDMMLPIEFALNWPKRVESPLARLDLASMPALTFAEPDFDAFPCLRLAIGAAAAGGTACAILNAANEIAVEAFRGGGIGFLDIGDVVNEVLDSVESRPYTTLEDVLAADAEARTSARAVIARSGART